MNKEPEKSFVGAEVDREFCFSVSKKNYEKYSFKGTCGIRYRRLKLIFSLIGRIYHVFICNFIFIEHFLKANLFFI